MAFLGRKKTHAKRVIRLLKKGYSIFDIVPIHGLVELDLGSATSAEIALTIVSEVVKCLRMGGFLAKVPIKEA